MGEFNALCAISDLPITIGDRVKMVFLKEDYNKGDTFWLPHIPTRWVPLMLPVSGTYQGHGFIEGWQEGYATTCLYDYFSGLEDDIVIGDSADAVKFECPRDFEALTDAMVNLGSFPRTKRHGKDHFAWTFVLEEVWDWGIQFAEESFDVYEFIKEELGLSSKATYREYLKATYDHSIQTYLMPMGRREADRKKGETTKEHFANGGLRFLDYPDSVSLWNKFYQAKYSRDYSSPTSFLRLFGEGSDLLAAGMAIPFLHSYDLQDEAMIQEMINLLMVCQMMERNYLNKPWQRLRTAAYGDDSYTRFYFPWLDFQKGLAEKKLQQFQDERAE